MLLGKIQGKPTNECSLVGQDGKRTNLVNFKSVGSEILRIPVSKLWYVPWSEIIVKVNIFILFLDLVKVRNNHVIGMES